MAVLGGWAVSYGSGVTEKASARRVGRLLVPSHMLTKAYQIEDVACHFYAAEVNFRTRLHEIVVYVDPQFDPLGVPRRASARRVGRLLAPA